MQDFQPLPGRIFGGGGGGPGAAEIRRLVGGYPASMAAAAAQQQQLQPQPVKCPRCDSTNTKFCYYNNYNLAQPRHFCKSCRRYWTKGGVLRNVPVGGGCRKSKRPSSSSGDKDSSQRRRLPSSSDTSTLTATTTPSTSTSTSAAATLLSSQIPADPPFCPASEIFPSPASPAAAAMVGFGLSGPPPPQDKPAELMRAAGFIDQTVPVDHRPGSNGGGLPALDWSGAIDSHLFDLTSVVDPTMYWNQSHWVDADPALYLP